MGKKLDMSDPVNQKMCALYQSGMSGVEVARQCGLSSHNLVYYRLAALGIPRRPQTGGLSQTRYCRMKEAGMVPLVKAAMQLHRSMDKFREVLGRLGIQVQQEGNWAYLTPADFKRVQKHFDDLYALTLPQTATEGELGWLAGIMDGEGTLATNFGKGAWNAVVSITNTCTSMIRKIMEICDHLQITYRYRMYKARRENKNTHLIHVGGPVSQWRFCKAVLPFLTTKKGNAEVMLEFCALRAQYQRRRLPKERIGEFAAKFDALRQQAQTSKARIV